MNNGASHLQLGSMPIHKTQTVVVMYKNITKIPLAVYFGTL